jgi:hypothetical protein
MKALDTFLMYARFMGGLPAHLRSHLTVEQAQQAVRRGLAARGDNFLGIARRGIYANPASPYLPLLRRAGCEYGDLETSVRERGLEPTLAALRAEGVYVTFEEYKGRRPIERGDLVIETDDHTFDNPLTRKGYEASTGGSTGKRGSRVDTDLDNLMGQAPHLLIARHVHGIFGHPICVWHGSLPDSTGIGIYLRAVPTGGYPKKWFTPITGRAARPALRFRFATGYLLAVSRLMGVPCPWPEPLPVERAVEIARWGNAAVREHGACELTTTISLAVRVAMAAHDAGIDLTGAVFVCGGEPFTAAKNAAIRRVGARAVPLYISEDTGPMGIPCVDPVEENDQHLLEDNLAVIQHPREVYGSGVEVDAFYFTALKGMASKVLLNMESDDYGIAEERDCGCALHELGYHRHLRRIRSFGKLTGEGVTLVGSEMLRVLEEVLPQRFGGTAQDFQLLEEEGDDGLARLTLLVHPDLNVEREEELIEVMLQELSKGSLAGGQASSLWEQASIFHVRRQPPIWTERGKLIPIRSAAIHGVGS